MIYIGYNMAVREYSVYEKYKTGTTVQRTGLSSADSEG